MIKTDKNKNCTHFPARLTGISIPLGALYTSGCTAIGEYPALAELIPFCTAASSGIGQSGKLLADLAGTGDWQEGKRFSSNASEEEVQDWVKSLNLN